MHRCSTLRAWLIRSKTCKLNVITPLQNDNSVFSDSIVYVYLSQKAHQYNMAQQPTTKPRQNADIATDAPRF